MPRVDLEALDDAVAFVSGALEDRAAWIDRETGEIVDPDSDDAPDDDYASARYVAVPTAQDLGFGRALALGFVREHLAERSVEAQSIFSRAGAFARFKDMLAAAGRLDEWYAFEHRERLTRLREWCLEQGLEPGEIERDDRSGN